MSDPSAGPAAGPSGHPHGLELPAHASAAALARGHVRKVLAEWGREDLTDSAELVTDPDAQMKAKDGAPAEKKSN